MIHPLWAAFHWMCLYIHPNFLKENMRVRILSKSRMAASLQTAVELEKRCRKRCKPIYKAVG